MKCFHMGSRGGKSSPGHPGTWGVLHRSLKSWNCPGLKILCRGPVASLCPSDYCNSGPPKLEFPLKSHAWQEEVWGLVSARRGSLKEIYTLLSTCQSMVQEGPGLRQFSGTDEWD